MNKAYLFIGILFHLSVSVICRSNPEKTCDKYEYASCPCGETGSVAVYVKMCYMKNLYTNEKFCEPCHGQYYQDKLCRRFRFCETCLEGSRKCRTCPAGAAGDFCMEDLFAPEGGRHYLRGHDQVAAEEDDRRFSRNRGFASSEEGHPQHPRNDEDNRLYLPAVNPVLEGPDNSDVKHVLDSFDGIISQSKDRGPPEGFGMDLSKFPKDKPLPPHYQERLKRQLKQQDVCEFPACLTTVHLHCTLYTEEVRCYAKCVYGYTFPAGIDMNYTCSYEGNKWMPHGFVECNAYVGCLLILDKAGYMKCHEILMTHGNECLISCTGYQDYPNVPERTYICNTTGLWSPPLPWCVKPRPGVTTVAGPNDSH